MNRHLALVRDTKEFLAALVEMTEGNADLDKRSIVKPGVSLRAEARRLCERWNTVYETSAGD